MTKLTDIQGIGQVYAERLSKAGISTPAKLIQKTAKPQHLRKLANSTGISERQLLSWSSRAKRVIPAARPRKLSTARRRARRSASEPTGTGGGMPGGGKSRKSK